MADSAKDILSRRQGAYRAVFAENPAVIAVMEDLERFCRANATTFHPDPRAHALLEGRREVWLRIKNYMERPLDDLMVIHKAQQDV